MGYAIVRIIASMKTLVAIIFGLGFVAFGVLTFIRIGSSQHLSEGKIQRIRAGEIHPETLTVVRKYLDSGKGAWPHVVFSCNRRRNVNMAVTPEFFNSVNPGDSIPAYYFPDGFFIPQSHRKDEGPGEWFLLGIGVLLGAGILAFAFWVLGKGRRMAA